MDDVDLARGRGRTLRVHVVGADDGPLVVYLHGAPSSRLDVDVLHERSRDRGVRVAAFDRPGFGGSVFAPFTFASVADDVAAVVESLGADRAPVVGQSAGAAYALASGALRGDRVSAVATGGAGAPFSPDEPWWAQLSEAEQRGVLLLGTADDEAERLLAEADLPYVRALDEDDEGLLAFWHAHLVPADRRYCHDGFDRYLLRSVRESLRPGQAGWARDNVVRMGPWAFDPADVAVPTTVWVGEQDYVPTSAWVHAMVPRSVLRVLSARGHFAVFEEWDSVLDDLGL
jgi:pimeloyl-ACP methyl ester carboxylesterase